MWGLYIRTVPSFRLAAEIERTKWKFRSYLDNKDRKMFDQMYDCVKLHNAPAAMLADLSAVAWHMLTRPRKQPMVHVESVMVVSMGP